MKSKIEKELSDPIVIGTGIKQENSLVKLLQFNFYHILNYQEGKN